MRALERYLQEIPSHFAQALCHDGCYFELRRFHPIHHLTDFSRMFSLLGNEPADEGGFTHIFLLANDRRSAIEAGDWGLHLSFHGDEERKEVFFRHLAQAAQETGIPETLSESLSLAARRQSDFWSYTGQEKSRSGVQESQETKDLRQWLKDTVLTGNGWDLQSIGEETILFERDYPGTLAEALLDGVPSQRPEWAGSVFPPNDVLYRGLITYLPESPYHAARLHLHDGVEWTMEFFFPPSDPRYPASGFRWLEIHPADGGEFTCYMILANDHQSAIVFANQRGEGPYLKRFTIAFYGDEEKKELLLSHLAKAAETDAT